jgi:hypothetical protein
VSHEVPRGHGSKGGPCARPDGHKGGHRSLEAAAKRAASQRFSHNTARDELRAEQRDRKMGAKSGPGSFDLLLEKVACPACPWVFNNKRGLTRNTVVAQLAGHYRKAHGRLGNGGDRKPR